jgi:peptide/nickel transport system ATP-binding protein
VEPTEGSAWGPGNGLSTSPILAVRNLSVTFGAGDALVRAVQNVSFDVYPGEALAIVGESGSGKSVTVLSLLGLLPAESGHRVSGVASFRGQDLLQLDDRRMRTVLGREIAMVFQDPTAALNPAHRIGTQIAEALLVHDRRLARGAAMQQAVDLMELVGIPQPDVRARQYPHQFSGGMCQRAMIAMAIANKPALLIADEPTTAVDVSIQAQLLNLLDLAQKETGAATILITHDMGVVAQAATRMCVMYSGRIVETAGVADAFRSPEHPYTASLLACIPRMAGPRRRLMSIPGHAPDGRERHDGCPFAPRCAHGANRDRCLTQRPELVARRHERHQSACHFPLDPPRRRASDAVETEERNPLGVSVAAADDPLLLDVRNLVKLFPLSDRTVLARKRRWVHAVDDLSFTLRRGETLGLVGESGCGKSTTARALMRLDEPTSGEVTFDGIEVRRARRGELRRIRQQVQMVFQNPLASLDPHLTAGDNVAVPLRLAGTFTRAQRRERVMELFDRVGLQAEHLGRLPRDFSGGQRQRIAIARALALYPKLVVLDEPTSALDVSVQAQLLNLLADLQQELGLAYIFVSHDLSVVRQVSDRVAVMYMGKIVEYGASDRVFAHPTHPYTAALLASVPSLTPRAGEPFVPALTGEVPSPIDPPSGCRFRTRCPIARAKCAGEEPALTRREATSSVSVACHFPLSVSG